jgi:hypothetical protein
VLVALSKWRQRSNVEIAKHIGVGEATVRRIYLRHSDEDAETSVPAIDDPTVTRIVHRGGQEYPMKAGRIGKTQEPAPGAAPVPLDPATLAATAEANTRKYVENNRRINNRDIRTVFRQLSEADRRRFLAEMNAFDDVVAWGARALDSQRRQASDAFFNLTVSVDEKNKHADLISAWLKERER